MDNCIYHSKDLDGLMSGAIVHHYQTSYWEPCKLHPYDYGETLDTRKFKGKTAVMIDVSMPMERMELLSTSCMEFMWIDHHVSAYNDLMDYCKEKNYEVLQHRLNDLVLCTEVKKMNLVYYYSNRWSGCELTAMLFDKNLSFSGKKMISLLGQYDTWRQFEDKKFVNDDDWENIVMPFQFGMRGRFNDPVKISDFLESLYNFDQKNNRNGENNFPELEEILNFGKGILHYQDKINETNMVNNSFEMDFDFEGKTLKAICLNTTVFNSGVFKSIYYQDYHDLMLAFQYSGKTDKYKFSLYTTKEDVNVLGIAKSFGGGGHPMACGFEISADDINIKKSVISIFNNRRKDNPDVNIGFLDFSEAESPADDMPFGEPKEIPVILASDVAEPEKVKIPKGYVLRKDQEMNNYWIPIHLCKKFNENFEEMKDEFANYKTGGEPGKCPEFLYEKLKDKL